MKKLISFLALFSTVGLAATSVVACSNGDYVQDNSTHAISLANFKSMNEVWKLYADTTSGNPTLTKEAAIKGLKSQVGPTNDIEFFHQLNLHEEAPTDLKAPDHVPYYWLEGEDPGDGVIATSFVIHSLDVVDGYFDLSTEHSMTLNFKIIDSMDINKLFNWDPKGSQLSVGKISPSDSTGFLNAVLATSVVDNAMPDGFKLTANDFEIQQEDLGTDENPMIGTAQIGIVQGSETAKFYSGSVLVKYIKEAGNHNI